MILGAALMSDTHGLHQQVKIPPRGDLLIHAGDCTRMGHREELKKFLKWFKTGIQPHKILVAGNHDFVFQRYPDESRAMCEQAGVTYLEDQAVELTLNGRTVKVYGMPWTPAFPPGIDWAFQLPRGSEELKAKSRAIPSDTTILVTHGPPFSVLDTDARERLPQGDQFLWERVAEVQPILHVFGHIHEGYGVVQGAPKPRYFNASICTVTYQPTNKPWVFELVETLEECSIIPVGDLP